MFALQHNTQKQNKKRVMPLYLWPCQWTQCALWLKQNAWLQQSSEMETSPVGWSISRGTSLVWTSSSPITEPRSYLTWNAEWYCKAITIKPRQAVLSNNKQNQFSIFTKHKSLRSDNVRDPSHLKYWDFIAIGYFFNERGRFQWVVTNDRTF